MVTGGAVAAIAMTEPGASVDVQRLGHARQLYLVEPDLMLGGVQSCAPHSTGQLGTASP